MTTRKPGPSEDWTHLGKLDTSRLLVRTEGAIWTGLAALGVPAGIIKVLKWSVRAFVLVAAAVYSLYLFVPLILICLALWLFAQSSGRYDKVRHDDEPAYGVERNVFGQTKGWFEDDSKYL